MEDLDEVGSYAWGAAFLAHQFDSLSASERQTSTSGGSRDIGEGFPNTRLKLASTKNPEQEEFGGFLGLPKESFNSNLVPFGAMASRGRRGGAPAREDKPRREERADQQVPAPQGPVLPPPPPVDYQVFMQGLVGDPTSLEETVESDSERGE
ncbi:hypothetical protein Taro_040641 [Colocasia esculenta]|uniref:Uncharacterized protein n=1 Tax=Colocasia esculenta TaxID=4460 RepID=A0A843WDQ8_COLES|nr:hypothetical protein [Colocasia esculenta]